MPSSGLGDTRQGIHAHTLKTNKSAEKKKNKKTQLSLNVVSMQATTYSKVLYFANSFSHNMRLDKIRSLAWIVYSQ